MPKVVDKREHKQWIVSQHNSGCCWAHIMAYHYKRADHFDNEIYITNFGFSNRDYYSGWRGRLKAIWSILRGKPLYEDLWFYEREDAEQFRNDFNEAIDFAFGKEEPKSYGGTRLCEHCNRVVSIQHDCPNNPMYTEGK